MKTNIKEAGVYVTKSHCPPRTHLVHISKSSKFLPVKMKLQIIAATLVVVVLATMVRAQQQVAFEALAPADYTVHSQPESLLTANEGVVRAKRQFGYGGYGGGFRGGYGRGFGGYGRGFGGGYGGGYGGYGGGFGGYGR